MEKKEVYTTGEIAKLCGVNTLTALRWIQRGQLKAFQLPGRGDNRVKKNDLMLFLKKHGMPTPKELALRDCVLAVDDDPRMVRSIQRLLKSEGIDTLTCTEGFKAGIMITSLFPKLVTLDLNMPGMGGLDIIKYIRGLDELKDVRILVVSAMPQKALGAALKAGADDVLKKPFDDRSLLDKVRALTAMD